MKRISIKPVWTLHDPDRPPLPPRLLDLLVQVQVTGSLLAACQPLGLSYRHAWDLVRQGEAHFDTALLYMARGKGSTLTPLGEKLVWADHRIHARLKPVLDSLASELSAELAQLVAQPQAALRLQASHGFAIERLVDALGRAGVPVEHRYGSSTEAVAALREGACDVAGLHIPLGPAQAAALAHYARWLDGDDLVVIDLATRRQGLMVAAGNPCKVYEVADLARGAPRFINRQVGSGTRLLLETMLEQAGITTAAIAGFEQGEFTHAAVAAYVASGMADVGFGLETAARQFKLDFIPLASERYFLLCPTTTLAAPALQPVLALLRSDDFRAAMQALPGYDPAHLGRVTPLQAAFAAPAPR